MRSSCPVSAPRPQDFVTRLDGACAALDEPGFDDAWHDAVVRLGIVEAVRLVLLPYLRLLGEQWESGIRSVAHEHFASGLSRRNLMRTISGSDVDDARPLVVVACPPGERHDLGPLAFCAVLADAGWRVRFLGADTPVVLLARTCQLVRPDLVVVSGTRSTVLEARTSAWRRLAEDTTVVLGGAGATDELAATTGLPCLDPDVTVALEQVARLVAPRTAVG